jgi:hypothetical protein
MSRYLIQGLLENSLLNAPVPFINFFTCPNGDAYHENGSGIFVLRGTPNNYGARYAVYDVVFTGNIAVPTGGTVGGPIATGLYVSGALREGSRSIITPAAVNQYGNVVSRALIYVPRGCCFNLFLAYTNGAVNDPAAVPTPAINIVDGSMDIEKVG